MVTETRNLPRSGSISSTIPFWFWNGPSATLTVSPTSNKTFGFAFLAFLDFGDALGRDEHFVDDIAHFFGFDALLDIILDLVLLAGEHVHNVPLILSCECLGHI